jgi:hypothetical protein
MDERLSLAKLLALVAAIGLFVGLGKLLASKEPLSWRLAVGRAIVGAGLSVAAAALLAFIPGLNQLALIGMASASAILGEQFLERAINSKAAIQP